VFKFQAGDFSGVSRPRVALHPTAVRRARLPGAPSGACQPLFDCPFHHFQYDVTTGENFFPRNVYPKDYKRLEAQLRPLRTYAVELRDGEVWVDLE
jgi:hypothetical protein